MESVGQILRNERLRQSLTLEEVSASTRISLKNLDAIENDDLKKISSPFFYRSFVRQFADRVGLEFSTVSAAMENQASSMPRPLIPGEDGAPLPRVASLRPARKFDMRWVSSVSSLVLVLAGCSSVYALWNAAKSPTGRAALQEFVDRFQGTRPQASEANKTPSGGQTEAVRQAPPPTQPSSPVEAKRDTPESVSPAATPDTPAASTSSAQGFHIEVSAIERTWISIVSDGKRVYSGVLQADQSKVLEGHDSALIRAGNAGGVEVVFNGKEIGTLGPEGQIRTVVFTKNNYEIVEPSEHALLSGFALTGFKKTVE